MFIVLAISTLFFAKEASWGGDRKIKETTIASPTIGIPKPYRLAILRTFCKRKEEIVVFSLGVGKKASGWLRAF